MKWLTLPSVAEWLECPCAPPTNDTYRHTVLKESSKYRAKYVKALRKVAKKAHEDAYRVLLSIWADPLDPLGERIPIPKPVQDYPRCLGESTLKGYFGEIMAGVLVKNLQPHGVADWHVPAFLFRFDDLSFDRIEKMVHDPLTKSKALPGHHGDDCVALLRDASGGITAALVCEAKCTGDHDIEMAKDAHKKLSTGGPRPTGLWRIAKVLEDSQDPDDLRLLEEIRKLMCNKDAHIERHDLVCYIYARAPKREPTWLPRSSPHPSYNCQRKLEVFEINIHDVDGLVKQVYEKGVSV